MLPRSARDQPGLGREAYPVAWAGWADPDRRGTLPDAARALLAEAFGISGEVVAPAPPPTTVHLPEPRLTPAAHQAIVGVVGNGQVRDDHDARLRHAAGRSTPDLLTLRSGTLDDAPDAVVAPDTPEEVQELLAVCAAERVAVVPFGGGTGVVGGVRALAGGLDTVIALDVRRLDRLVAVEPIDRTAVLQAGLLAPQADALLRPHGLMLGHHPQSYERATIGGFAATRSSGQSSCGYGRFDEMVVGLRIATPAGELRLGRGPATAAGPDLRELFLGSEGILGVITEVTVRVQSLPEATRYEGWRLPDVEQGLAALRDLARSGERPTVVRLSDEVESAMRLPTVTADQSVAAGGASGADNTTATTDNAPDAGGCLVIVGWDGVNRDAVDGRAGRAAALLEARGGVALGAEPGESWRRGRFDAPYLRDDLLDRGILVETLETVAPWSALHGLRSRLTAAIQGALRSDHGAPVIVMGHVSHVYADGASLYLTVICRREEDARAQWARAKQAAGDEIARSGASITHHHAVGTDHAPWMSAEVGELGLEVLRAIKARLDPTGIMNPGKLLPL